MAEEWALSDDGLSALLTGWRIWLSTQPTYQIALFQNDYHPVPGVALGDLVEADFEGYGRAAMDNTDWVVGAVTGNVARAVNGTVAHFEVENTFVGSQLIYGFFVTNDDGDLRWVVRFATPRELFAFDKLDVTLDMKQKNTT